MGAPATCRWTDLGTCILLPDRGSVVAWRAWLRRHWPRSVGGALPPLVRVYTQAGEAAGWLLVGGGLGGGGPVVDGLDSAPTP